MSAGVRAWLAPIVAAGFALCASSQAHAHATLTVKSMDADGEGFNDPKPVAPVGGNTGKTLGEQRLNAVQHAADLWGKVLDSDVTIEIEATFDPLGCTSSTSVLGQASPAGVDLGVARDGGDASLLYPDALANRLAGMDLHSDEPDIIATFNSSIGDANCLGGLSFYYGLDGAAGDAESDLVNVALHEFGHGLGVVVFANLMTGALLGGAADAYSTHVLDLSSGKRWDQMSDSERLSSLVNARKVVWQGPHVLAAAGSFLLHGTPHLRTTPAVSGFSGILSDTSFGARPSAVVSAPLMVGNPLSGCTLTPNVVGKIVLLVPSCLPSAVAAMLASTGARGVLMAMPANWDTPPMPIEEQVSATVPIPVLSIAMADATVLQTAIAAGAVSAQISFDSAQLMGADTMGQVLLNATQPASGASSISHWDTSARPNLLMEPVSTPGQPNEVDLTAPMLVDLGWARFCGNARIDQEEACDDGEKNSDSTPDACRSDCRAAHCGDGVKDKAEACDDGEKNSDRAANACRSDCNVAHCGDAVVDKNEACDHGRDNSDTTPDACRSDCRVAHCGDGVRDQGEACDQGAQNSDTTPDACRSDCSAARCGDGVTDQSEGCDDGPKNDDATPDACRSDCKLAGCGDGVIDQGEACDDGAGNSDTLANACRGDCSRAHCGDKVKDRGETCDDGSGQCKKCKPGSPGSGASGANPDGGTAGSKGNSRGCSCTVLGAGAESAAVARGLWFAGLAAGVFVRTRHRRRRRQAVIGCD